MFNVIKSLELKEFYGTTKTTHFSKDRMEREKVLESIGIGSIILSTEVDTNHPNGNEIYQLTNTGIVFIFNKESHKLVTTLIARPGQVKRYYEPFNKPTPISVINLAREHQIQNLNNV